MYLRMGELIFIAVVHYTCSFCTPDCIDIIRKRTEKEICEGEPDNQFLKCVAAVGRKPVEDCHGNGKLTEGEGERKIVKSYIKARCV